MMSITWWLCTILHNSRLSYLLFSTTSSCFSESPRKTPRRQTGEGRGGEKITSGHFSWHGRTETCGWAGRVLCRVLAIIYTDVYVPYRQGMDTEGWHVVPRTGPACTRIVPFCALFLLARFPLRICRTAPSGRWYTSFCTHSPSPPPQKISH